MSALAALESRRDEIVRVRHDIHAHPELAFDEHRTAALVAERLRAAGIETHTGIGRTGVVGVIRRGNSPRAIALRADMDALPITELNEFSHRSRHAGRMHACGHDGHTTMLLAAAEHLAVHPDFDGTVVFIFQPAEEGEGGAPAMIADGLFERFPVDAVFGMHNWPEMPAGRFGVTPGPVMASADRFDITITGRGAHAAMPQQGLDPVIAGAQLVTALQTIASRSTDPLDAVVLSVTQFHAGEAYNAIPTRADLCGTVRTLRPEVRKATRASMQRVIDGVAAAFGLQIEMVWREGYPPTVNSDAEAAFCRDVLHGMIGADRVDWAIRPSMGAEDFAYFLEKKPGCYVWIGNGAGAGGCMLHNARYDFNDEILTLGASYWVKLVQAWCPPA
ncbi:M20 aminoacylase family protein [Uliginosibacterium sp. H1]|uniref:M20 aminoacylase family protein n=1 Tax=Uliginosibacterium sp. H1 TaxID=3114757 RepID=UPI002E180653|nr:M20 aminoacylase family protein [Uliginosibacterium sp. H1]